MEKVSIPSNRGNVSDDEVRKHTRDFLDVSIPSNRGNVSDENMEHKKLRKMESQSPLIGAMFPTRKSPPN